MNKTIIFIGQLVIFILVITGLLIATVVTNNYVVHNHIAENCTGGRVNYSCSDEHLLFSEAFALLSEIKKENEYGSSSNPRNYPTIDVSWRHYIYWTAIITVTDASYYSRNIKLEVKAE